MCPNRQSPDYPIEDSVHRHSNTNIQRPSHSPWPPHPTYHVIRGRSDHHEQKGPSHTSTERPQLKPSADWLTRTASHLSTKWVWTKECIYFQGLYGSRWGTCYPYLNTPGHKAFGSQLTANKLGGLRFAGVGPKWSTVQPRSARANPLWQPRALGIWGRYLPTKIPHLSGTPDAHGSGLQLMPPPGTSR